MAGPSLALCAIDEIPDGQARGFDVLGTGQDQFFVVRRGEALHAWRNDCPHIPGAPMAWRRHAYLSADRQHIVCHAHGAQFDIATGVCLLGPCLGEHLTPVPVWTAVRAGAHGETRCVEVATAATTAKAAPP